MNTMERIRLIAQAAQRVTCDNCPHTQDGHSKDKGCDCSKFTYPYPAMMAAIREAFAA